MVFKATVVNLEVKKPAGKWKGSGESYAKVLPDPDTGLPRGLGLASVPSPKFLGKFAWL